MAGLVGDILKFRVGLLLYRQGGCGGGCWKTQQRMNELGPQGCRREFESLIDEMRINAKESKQLWSEIGARFMLNWAIKTAEKALAEAGEEEFDEMAQPMPRGTGSGCQDGLRGVFLNDGEFERVLAETRGQNESDENLGGDRPSVVGGQGHDPGTGRADGEPADSWAEND